MTIQSNIWKYIIHIFTTRRNFIPILSIYFMTFPDNTIKQLGFMTGIGSLLGFLIEIPSGYLGDRIGHKKTLILAKFCLVCSTVCFIIGGNFWIFALGSMCMALGHAFNSGTQQALLHETLTELKREKEYTKVSGKIGGNVSLASVVLIISLPFLVKIDFRIPFWVGLGFDIIGLINAFLFVQPTIFEGIKKKKTMWNIFQDFKAHTKVFLVAIFFAITFGVCMSTNGFRGVYLQSIGFPVVLIGLVMGISRIIWRGLSKVVYLIENNISLAQLMFFEIFLYGGSLVLIGLLGNPYVVGGIFAFVSGYQWARQPLITNFILKNLQDKSYKATVLSIQSQISAIISFSLMFIIGFVMEKSYMRGFIGVGIVAFVSLSVMLVLSQTRGEK